MSFFYIAFVALYLPKSEGDGIEQKEGYLGQCGWYNCMQPLSTNLAIIYASRLTSNNIIEFFMTYYTHKNKVATEIEGMGVDLLDLTPPEIEYTYLESDPLNDSITLFADITIQFGFSVLFVVALPICFLATFISNIVRSRMSVYQMLKWHQRYVYERFFYCPILYNYILLVCVCV